MRFLVVTWGMLVAVVGCTAASSPEKGIAVDFARSRADASGSLFDTDKKILQAESIEKILNAKVVIPKQARLAVLRFGRGRPWLGWSKELTQLDQDVQKGIVRRLSECKRLADVSLLPSLMTPEKQTIPYLREAAARFQADLLLVYRATSRFYGKQRFFRPGEVKAQCVVEAILLDVRSGLVPFTSVDVQEYTKEEERGGYGYLEARDRAELQAVSKALDEIASRLVSYLESTP